ncbi:DUF2535 family protein [Falsibacillus albus]|uniref:DUF2535 family protein n=1 Tax=Falsibacillus albus TaxID=2478915 RepID=A0A3L7JWM1_9BACI|nr:DUF2535 family protein [Falsibacillus albus]RLQ95247.1 DUF2535 family protein [Falsibacillus albus]
MLLKSLEFKTTDGQKVKIIDIPVLEEDSPLKFKVNVRLELFMRKIISRDEPKKVYSLREHLKKTLKWTEYEQIYRASELKNNA